MDFLKKEKVILQTTSNETNKKAKKKISNIYKAKNKISRVRSQWWPSSVKHTLEEFIVLSSY